MNFTHFVGTVSGSDAAMKLLDVVRATLRTTFRSRFELRVPRFFFDLRFVAAKVAANYAELLTRKQDVTADYENDAMKFLCGRSFACRSRQPERSPTAMITKSRPSHVGASACIDLDRFAFLDEKRNVDCFSGLQLCWLGDVAGRVAADAF